MRGVGMCIRIEPKLRGEFVDDCKQLDLPAAQVIRAYVCEYIQANAITKT